MDGPQSDKPILDLDVLVASRKNQYSGARQRLDRSLQMIKTYPPGQILSRISKVVRNRFGIRYQPDNQNSDFQIRENTSFANLVEQTASQLPQPEIAGGHLTLLNQKYEVGCPIDWRTAGLDPRPSHLWRFQLHYHEWLLPLGANSNFVWETVDHWIDNNRVTDPLVHSDAWHPYCISRRLPVWQKLLAVRDEPVSDSVALSIFDQADFLSKNLETDLRGNHLLENLHALALSACFFEGDKPAQWQRLCVDRLKTELKMQVLESGEHYERSPMYQCVVCANLLQLALVSQGVSEELCDLATLCASRMWKFLSSILCPDGEIPLLSDSCFGEAPSVQRVRQFAEMAGIEMEVAAPGYRVGTCGDYWVHRSDNRDYLLFDAGQLAADGLPGHAHCDLLNVVGSVRGQRVIVDSGNGSYDLDAARAYCRSSVAHNVLTVDGLDHADVWSKFRMGFRGQPASFRTGATGGFDWAMAEHNAYRRCGIASIKRIVLACQDGLMWACLDSIDDGSSHRAEGYLHFAESATVCHQGQDISLTVGDLSVDVGFFGCDSVELAKSWHYSEFGRKKRNYTAVYRAAVPKSQLLGWFLCSPADKDSSSIVAGNSPTSVIIKYKNRSCEIDLQKL